MSHSGWSASNYITPAGTVVTAAPLTFHARLKPSAVNAQQTLVAVTDGTTTNMFTMGVTSGAKPQVATFAAGGATATGATSLSNGSWYSLAGRFTSATDRKIFLDGVQDATNNGSQTPAGLNTARIGIRTTTTPALGSLAEVAIWGVALSDDEIAALVFKSPRSIRPGSLVTYLKLLDNGSRDEMALPATITGTLTKDTDHPRVYYPRKSGLIVPFEASGAADLSASAAQAFTIGQTASADMILAASAAQGFAIGQSSSAVLSKLAEADQAFMLGQSATATGGTLGSGQILGGGSWPDDEGHRPKRKEERRETRRFIEEWFAKANGELDETPAEVLAEPDATELERAAARAVQIVAPYMLNGAIDWAAFEEHRASMERLETALAQYQQAVLDDEEDDELLLLS